MKKGTALGRQPAEPSCIITTTVLDERIDAVHRIRHSVNVGFWALGSALNEIHVSRAWMSRLNDAGVPAYPSWKEFCRAEIRIPLGTVSRLTQLARRFTELQVKAYGTSRLSAIMSAPEEAWGGLLRECDGGITVVRLRESVRAIKAAARPSTAGSSGPTFAATIAAEKSRRVARESRGRVPIVAVPRPGAQASSLRLLARCAPGEAASKPARSIAQQPRGSFGIEGLGDVSMSIYEGPDGELCVDWQFTPSGSRL